MNILFQISLITILLSATGATGALLLYALGYHRLGDSLLAFCTNLGVIAGLLMLISAISLSNS